MWKPGFLLVRKTKRGSEGSPQGKLGRWILQRTAAGSSGNVLGKSQALEDQAQTKKKAKKEAIPNNRMDTNQRK